MHEWFFLGWWPCGSCCVLMLLTNCWPKTWHKQCPQPTLAQWWWCCRVCGLKWCVFGQMVGKGQWHDVHSQEVSGWSVAMQCATTTSEEETTCRRQPGLRRGCWVHATSSADAAAAVGGGKRWGSFWCGWLPGLALHTHIADQCWPKTWHQQHPQPTELMSYFRCPKYYIIP